MRIRSFIVAALSVLLVPLSTHASITRYQVKLSEINDSGVTGRVDIKLNGDELTVALTATGLEPKHLHPAHIHGFVTDKKSSTSFKDYNHNGDIDDYEGELFVGPVIQPLTLHPEGNPLLDYHFAPHGKISYKVTYDLGDEPGLKEALTPLSIRAVEVHGMTSNGMYDPEFPVAAGLVKKLSSSSSGFAAEGSGGATAVPLPPAGWAGLITMTGAAAISLIRKRLALS